MAADPVDFQTLQEHAPYAQYEVVDVTFGDAHTDTEIQHSLQPPTPEHIDYKILRQGQAAIVYHDMTAQRKAWRDGVITLRSDVAGARVRLLLTVEHKQWELNDPTPPNTVPATAPHTHDAADTVSGVFNVARIPDLSANKITSDTFADARIPNLAASKITSGTFDTARIPDLSANKITSDALAKARQHAQTAYKDEANTFSVAGNTFAEILNTSKGIAFPATQVASSNANTLDDYEEGSWTPTITGSTSGSGQTYSIQEGKYIKIGRLVAVTGAVFLTNAGSITGNVEIAGLPFTVQNVSNGYFATSGLQWSGLATNWVNVYGLIQPNTTRITMRGANAAAANNATSMVPADIANTSSFVITAVYFTDN